MLAAYAQITHERPQGTELASLLHRGEHIAQAHQHLTHLIEDLLAEAAGTATSATTPNLASWRPTA